jgi:hypothetical protein
VKDVPDLANVGFPIVEMQADGTFVVTKPAGTGGCIDRMTVSEQILYEVHDPAAYLTPDVVADISETELLEAGPDRIEVRGIRGHARPESLKATVCYEGGWLAEGEISYAGPNAAARAKLAGEVVHRRLGMLGLGHLRTRCDLIGVTSVFADDAGQWWGTHQADLSATDVRLRVAAATMDKAEAEHVTHEVLALYTCGPAGGGGVRTAITPRLRSDSCFVPRDWLRTGWRWA